MPPSGLYEQPRRHGLYRALNGVNRGLMSGGERESEAILGIAEPSFEAHSGLREHGLRAGARELARDLGPDGFVGAHVDLEVELRYAYVLVGFGREMHLDPGLFDVIEGDVAVRLGMEVGFEPVVHDAQNVAVELRGYASAVVVRRLQHRLVLDEVDAEQEPAIRIKQAANVSQECPPLVRLEVADGAPQKDREAVPFGWGHRAQVALEVADDRVDDHRWVAFQEARATTLKHLSTDVEGQVASK